MVHRRPQTVPSSHSSSCSEKHRHPAALVSPPLLAVPSAGSPATFRPSDFSAVSLRPAHGTVSSALSTGAVVE
jgi:hypothetical protein